MGKNCSACLYFKLTFVKLLQDLFRKRDRGPEYDLTFRAIQCVTFFGVPLEGMSIQSLEPITDARDHDAMRRTLGDIQEQSELLNELRTSLAGFQGINFITCEEQKLTKARVSSGMMNDFIQKGSLRLGLQGKTYR